MTQNSPDILLSGLSASQSARYRACPCIEVRPCCQGMIERFLTLPQEPLLERTGKLEFFLQSTERNGNNPFVDVLHNAPRQTLYVPRQTPPQYQRHPPVGQPWAGSGAAGTGGTDDGGRLDAPGGTISRRMVVVTTGLRPARLLGWGFDSGSGISSLIFFRRSGVCAKIRCVRHILCAKGGRFL